MLDFVQAKTTSATQASEIGFRSAEAYQYVNDLHSMAQDAQSAAPTEIETLKEEKLVNKLRNYQDIMKASSEKSADFSKSVILKKLNLEF